jgi:UrcA family protein
MNKSKFNARTSLMFAGMILAGAAFAAEEPAEITITATQEAKVVVGHTAIGAPIELVTLTRHVSYADLDLSKSADAATLEGRVTQTVKDACKELDDRYPLEPATASECTKISTDKAMVQVHHAVAAASKH